MNSYIRQASVPHDNIHSFFKDKHAWENAIAMYQGPDPLNNWYNYICWYKNHGHGDPENKFRETLERCLTIFEHNEYYKQDPRMVRLWLKYIEMQQNPLHFYQVLHQRGVGKHLAFFYVAWGSYYESISAFKEAEAVYNLGFQEKAQPFSELHHSHSKLIYARQIVSAQQLRISHPNQSHMQQSYFSINQEGIKSADQGLVYKSVENHNIQNANHLAQVQEYSVYQQNNICYEQVQPNTYNYQQNHEVPINQSVSSNYELNIYENTNYQQLESGINNQHIQPKHTHAVQINQTIQTAQSPETAQVQPTVQYIYESIEEPKHENEIQCIQLPPKFSSYSYNNFETWKPALFLEEPDDPNKICCYMKHRVYPSGVDMEFSPEELRAQKYGYSLTSDVHYNEYFQDDTRNYCESTVIEKNQKNSQEQGMQKKEDSYHHIHELQSYKDVISNSIEAGTVHKHKTEQPNGTRAKYEEMNGSRLHPYNRINYYEQAEKEYEQSESKLHRFTAISSDDGSQNKSIKIKFKKERPSDGDSKNYAAYSVESVYHSEVSSPKAASTMITNIRKNGHNFHPYLLGHTSTPKSNASKRNKYKTKSFGNFQNDNDNTSNSCSAEEATNDHEYVQTDANVNLYNDNANNSSFFTSNLLENSNCSISSAVERLNFHDSTNIQSNNTIIEGGDVSAYQENSYFITQNDVEARKVRQSKAEEVIKKHFDKEAVDPFNSELCRAFLTKIDFPGSEDEHAIYKIVNVPLPKINNTKILNLPNDINFNIDKEVGKGSYGSVYKATDVKTGSTVALKYQKPPNTWEIYICDQVFKRIKDPTILPGFMDISTAIIAPNASLIATEFSPYGSLLDINNKIRQATTKVMHESLVMHFSAQICRIVNELHKNKIIHADIKPDNFLLMRIPSTDLSYPTLRLIDFGCAIDMSLFPDSDTRKFRKIIQTDGFTCVEMQEGKPWSYETDLFCIAGTVHVMLFGEYMQLQKRSEIWDIKQKLPRYLKKHVWTNFFGNILNICSSKGLPNLKKFQHQFEEESQRMDSDLRQQIRTLSNILHRR